MKKLFLAVAVLCLTIPVSAQTANRLSLMSAKTAPLRENPNVQYVQKAQSEPTVNSAQMTTEFVCAYPIHHLYLGQSEPTVNNNTQMTTLFHETFNNGIRNGKWDVDSSTTNILYYTTVSPMAKTVPDTAQVFAFYPAGGLSTKPNYADPFARLVSNWIKLNGAENCWAYFDWLYEASNAPNSNISLGIAMRTSPGAEWTPVAHEIGGTTLTGNKKFGTPESSSGKIPTEMASADSIQLCVFLGHSTSQTLQFMFYFDNIKIVSFGGQTDGPKADLAVKSPGTITESATTFKTTATVTNQSDIPIKSLVIASKLNDGNVQYQQITIDPEIGVLSSLEIFVDLLGLTNDNIGTNNFVYWISQINNFSFEPETVGRTECSVYIPNPNDAVYPIKYLVEHFTSSTCGPCAPNNVTMNPFYDAQEAAGKLIFVKYQMNWPGTGDPYYVAQDGGVRRNYYAVNAVPMMFGNAAVKENKDEMTADITKLEGKKAYMGIDFNSAWVDSVSPTTKNISIDYNITSKLNTEATVHTIILENVTYKNKRTNGETEFHHVVMGMFPDGNGSTTLFKKDSTYNFSFVYNMAASNIEEFNDLKLVVFIQNYATKEIYGNAQRDVSARVQTATPIINPAIGNFSDSVFVTISAATYGATIYYTVDGSVPTSASTLYSGGFYIKDEKTVKAIAVKSDYLDSEVSSVTYTKAVATPVINPSDSVFPDSVFVTISTPTSGADIYYTIDGSTPTSSSLLYSGGFYVSTTTTVKAIATKSGEKNSDIAIALYTKRQVATPEIEPYRIELFMDSLLITISTATPDAEIYYTVDGSAPTTSSLLYGGSGFYINSTKTIKAIGVKEGFDNSGIVVATYSKSKVNIPVINPSERNFIDSLLITISTTTPDAEIYYTVDGSAPTTSSFLYDSSGFYINSTKTIKAIGVKGGYENSDVVSATFTKSPSSANENLSNAISVKVYPNPVTDFITVESPANSTLLLYNSVGVLVYQGVGGNRKLPVASMPSGVYTLKVVSDKGVATQKIVKK